MSDISPIALRSADDAEYEAFLDRIDDRFLNNVEGANVRSLRQRRKAKASVCG